jgi:hypothetical protein
MQLFSTVRTDPTNIVSSLGFQKQILFLDVEYSSERVVLNQYCTVDGGCVCLINGANVSPEHTTALS